MEFVIELKDGKQLFLDDVEVLLEHDNTVANPICELSIEALHPTDSDVWCRVQMKAPRDRGSTIYTVVQGSDASWCSRLSDQLEEQIERISLRGGLYKLIQFFRDSGFLLLFFLAPVVLLVFGILSNQSQSNRMQELVDQARAATTQEQKLDALIALGTFSVEHGESKGRISFKLPTLGAASMLVILPGVILLALVWYAIRYCYPKGVFVWGDWAEYYKQLLDRRRTIWNVVFIALVLAVVANLSSGVIARWLGV